MRLSQRQRLVPKVHRYLSALPPESTAHVTSIRVWAPKGGQNVKVLFLSGHHSDSNRPACCACIRPDHTLYDAIELFELCLASLKEQASQ